MLAGSIVLVSLGLGDAAGVADALAFTFAVVSVALL
jgi:hypothetical protein